MPPLALRVGPPEGITSLAALADLRTVGALTITENAALTDLTGLDGVTTVAGNLVVSGNAVLVDLTGLSGVRSVGRDLFVGHNDVLQSLEGMDALEAVGDGHLGGSLEVWDNDALTTLAGLRGLTTIATDLDLRRNEGLLDLGLDALEELGGRMVVYGNGELSRCALEALAGRLGATCAHLNEVRCDGVCTCPGNLNEVQCAP